jgi:hypothetical protein
VLKIASLRAEVVGLALMLPASCAPAPEAGSPVEEIPSAVVNGQEAQSCQFPSVAMVLLSSGLCSGTLVHPRLVTFAAHCQLAGTVRAIYFGENAASPTRKVDVTSCKFYPNYKANVNDVAYCVLAEEVKDIPIAPVLMGCETSVLQKGKMLDLVGFGITSMKEPRSYGIKRWTSVPLLNTPGPTTNIAQVGTTSNGCEGDSGGPIMVKLDDGTWRTAGVASTTAVDTQAMECIAPTNYVLVHRYVDWIEAESGIDITPCHDADGTWHPGPDCGQFATSSDLPTGSWDLGCNVPGAVSSKASTTCAAAPGGVDATAHRDSGSAPPPDASGPALGPPHGEVETPAPTPDGGLPDATPTLGLPASHDHGCAYSGGGRGSAGATALAFATLALIARRRQRPPAR